MAKLRASTIEPEGATTALTLGASGDTVTVSSDMIKANTFKDAGGNTLWTSDGSGTLSSVNSGISGGGLIKISTSTSINVNNIDITGIDSTYDEYMIIWTGIGCQSDGVQFLFQGSTDGGSTWGVTWTTTFYYCYNLNSGSSNSLNYDTGEDEANNTNFMPLNLLQGYEAYESTNGFIHIFNPSSTTFQKHFYTRCTADNNSSHSAALDTWTAGYWNTTSVINAVQFKMSSGAIDGGQISLYGVS